MLLHEKPLGHGPPLGDIDGMTMSWKREKRRRKHLNQPISSDAPTAAAQGHQVPISYLVFRAANDDQGPISDMAAVQVQNHALLSTTETREEEEALELFGPEVNLSMENEASYAQFLLPNIRPPISMTPSMSWMDYSKVQVRHGRYRITYYKAMNPESGCNFKDPDAYSDDEIANQEFFEHLQDDESFEWFFHTDDSWIPDLNDYQRITLRNFMPGRIEPEYSDVDVYRERYHTYDMDAVFVKYYGEISKKIKWIEDFLHLDDRSAEWIDIATRGWRQALRIATRLPHMTVCLASFAYKEYIRELRDDASLKDLDLVYFEIWRLVVKDNRNYMDSVKEVHAMDKFHMHKRIMEAELTGAPVFFSIKHRMCDIIKEGDIFVHTEDNKARDLFRKGVAQLKTKNMVNYAEKKMEIAERLNLHKRIEISGHNEVREPGRKH